MSHRFTKPLLAAEDGLPLYSDGYRLVELVHTLTSLRLDQWQADLIVRVLERCPPGHPRAGQLRYRQVTISIPRQAGKSVIASVLALYALIMHSDAPKVLGVARNAKQAGLVYGYTKAHINGSKKLSRILKARGTAGLGISKRKGEGSYVVLAGDSDALQGYPSTLAIVDELHIVKPDIYDAIVTSQRAQVNPLLVGITTAGDINSVLLKRLYATGEEALAGTRETFGFFVWEASNPDEFTIESIIEANPAVACGRIDAQTIYDEERDSPPANWKRYALNVFVDGLAEPWVPVEDWAKCAGIGLTEFKNVIYSIEVAEAFRYATISAYRRDDDGIIRKALVARLKDPDPETLKQWCDRLYRAGRCSYVLDGYKRSKFLADYLEDKNRTVLRAGSRRAEAAAITYAAIKRGEVEHDNQPMVNHHHATARTKSSGEDFVVVSNGTDIDCAYADVYGIYAAETLRRKVLSVA